MSIFEWNFKLCKTTEVTAIIWLAKVPHVIQVSIIVFPKGKALEFAIPNIKYFWLCMYCFWFENLTIFFMVCGEISLVQHPILYDCIFKMPCDKISAFRSINLN